MVLLFMHFSQHSSYLFSYSQLKLIFLNSICPKESEYFLEKPASFPSKYFYTYILLNQISLLRFLHPNYIHTIIYILLFFFLIIHCLRTLILFIFIITHYLINLRWLLYYYLFQKLKLIERCKFNYLINTLTLILTCGFKSPFNR